jgi:membrane associated rhomboid family serine protease
MFIPYLAEVSMKRWPIANFVLIFVTVVVSFAMFGPLHEWAASNRWLFFGGFSEPEGSLKYLLLQPDHFNPTQLVGSTLIHSGFFHLLGNMIFLWVFGNAVNAKLGHLQYIAFYVCAAVTEGSIYILFSKAPCLGASGAIMGVVGAFVVMNPACDIRVFWIIWVKVGAGTLQAMWLVAIYVAFDIWGLIKQEAGVAYISHVAGFGFGFGLTWLLVRMKWIESDRNEKNLLQVFGLQALSAEQEEAFGEKPAHRVRMDNRQPPTRGFPVPDPKFGAGIPRTPPAKKRDEGPISLD